ncbi:FKBP12-associated protein [Aspergillus alliaceus]|uniref:FKBP12-associated protein n=1 Tax=Petromyces alliaceus TaxID=209559 RepID=A0A8H6AEA9_PETAA|nr:FKBP12-associated protein [Aspergillus burnettii]
MSDNPAPIAEGSTSRSRPSRRGGRGRGNRNPHRRPQTQTTESSHDTQSSSQQSPQAQPTQPLPSDPPHDAPRSRRRPRRGRGGRGGGAPPEASDYRQRERGGDRGIASAGRRFEGRLTKPEQASGDDQAGTTVGSNDLELRADAPEFVPGTQPENVTSSATPAATKKKSKPKSTPPPPPKVTTKSVAPDIATRIHEDIAHNLYECPICTAELGKRNGQRMKVPLRRTLPVVKERATRIHLEPGAALDVTLRMKCFRQATHVGARKKSIRGRSPVSRHTPAGKPVHDHVKAAHIRAIRLAMLDLVSRVQLWVLLRIAFAVGTRLPSVAKIPIMKMDGAAAKYAAIFCPAVSILALDHVTKVFAVLAR